MRKTAFWLLASLSIATTACVRTATNEATGAVDVDVESPTKRGEDWKGTLKGQGMFTSVTGSARALYSDGRTTVTVNLENATPSATYMWNLREGKCSTNGPVVGDNSAHTTLTVGSDGKAGSTVTINARLDEAKNYSVHVYATDMTTVIACGEIDD